MGFRLSGGRVAQGYVAGPRRVGERFPVDRDFLVSFRRRSVGNRRSRARRRIVIVELVGAATCISAAPATPSHTRGRGRRRARKRWGLLRRGSPAGSPALAPGGERYAERDPQQDLSNSYVSHCDSLLARLSTHSIRARK